MKKLTLLAAILSVPFSLHAETVIGIGSCDDLLTIKNRTTESYQLESDIDCAGEVLTKPIDFKGKLNGNYHTISGLKIRSNDRDLGLFSNIYDATINNLTLEAITVESTINPARNVGILGGTADGAILVNISVKDSLITEETKASNAMGGLVGYGKGISVVSFNGIANTIHTTDRTKRVGGMAGLLSDSTASKILISEMDLQVYSELDGRVEQGGFVGRMNYSSLDLAKIEGGYIRDTYEGGNNFAGGSALMVGGLNQSTIEHADAVDVTTTIQNHGENWRTGIIAGWVWPHKNSEKIVMSNITINDPSLSLPWFNSDPSDIVRTENLLVTDANSML